MTFPNNVQPSFPPLATPPTQPRLPSVPSSSGNRSQRRSRNRRVSPDVPHTWSFWNKRCPSCASEVIGPIWSPTHNRYFVKCFHYDTKQCGIYRWTNIGVDHSPAPTPVAQRQPLPIAQPLPTNHPPPPAPNAPPSTAPATQYGICLHPSCTTKRTKISATCTNKMCKSDCVRNGPQECAKWDHKQARQQHLGLAPPPRQARAVPNELPFPALVTAAAFAQPQPPPQPTAALQQPQQPVASSSTQPVLPITNGEGVPPPTFPSSSAPAFEDVQRCFGREVPAAWGAWIASQQAIKAQEMAHAARFRTEIFEGLTVFVAFWVEDSERPRIMERIVRVGSYYTLSEDIDVCAECKIPPETRFVDFYQAGTWIMRSPRESIQVEAGAWLFFRTTAVSTVIGFDGLLALSTDPAFRGASKHVQRQPTRDATAPPANPMRGLGIPSASASTSMMTAPTSSTPSSSTASASSSSSSSTCPVAPPTSTPTSDISATSSTSAASVPIDPPSQQPPPPNLQDVEERQWPFDFTVKEIHNGMVRLRQVPRGRNGTADAQLRNRFTRVWPGVAYSQSTYYRIRSLWSEYAASSDVVKRNVLEDFIKRGTTWEQFAARRVVKKVKDVGKGKGKARESDYIDDDDDDDEGLQLMTSTLY